MFKNNAREEARDAGSRVSLAACLMMGQALIGRRWGMICMEVGDLACVAASVCSPPVRLSTHIGNGKMLQKEHCVFLMSDFAEDEPVLSLVMPLTCCV